MKQVIAILLMALSVSAMAANNPSNNTEAPSSTPSQSASPSLGDAAHNVGKNLDKTNQELDKIAAMMNVINTNMIECELDPYCFYQRIEKIAKTDPQFEPLYTRLHADKERLDQEHKNCTSEPLKALRKGMIECMKHPENQNDIQACLLNKLNSLANDGNLYAQNSLAKQAERQGNPEEAKKWLQKIEEQKDKEAYKEFKNCSQYLN